MIKSIETIFKTGLMALGLAGTALAPAMADEFIGGDINVELNTDDDVAVLAADVSFTGRVGGDIEGLAADVEIDAQVGGDIALAAADINIAGSVGGDVDAAGASITLMANVMGEANLAGADISVAGMIGEDLSIAGAFITLEASSVINGNVEAVGGEFFADGRIIGSLDVEAEEVYLRGVIDGPIEIYAREITIGPDAVIQGPITVRGPNAPTVAESAQVPAIDYIEEEWDERRIKHNDLDLDFDVLPSFWALGALYSSAALMLGLIVALLFPRSMARMSEKFRERPWVSAGLGLIVWATLWIMLLVLIVLLAITLVGILLAPFIAAAIPIIYFLSFVFGGVVIGDLIFNRSGGQAGFLIRAVSLIVVMLVIAGLHVLPPVGLLIGLVVHFIGFGAWTLALFDRQKKVGTLEGDAV